jgi:hypothetical protein
MADKITGCIAICVSDVDQWEIAQPFGATVQYHRAGHYTAYSTIV